MTPARTIAAALLATLGGGSTISPPYANPVIDTDFPDPSVVRAGDGAFYLYATQGNGRNIQTARSRDLVHWRQIGDAMPIKPRWAATTQDFWAPHVSVHAGRYYMYFSAKPDPADGESAPGLCLGVATAARPEGPFVDRGTPLQCGEGFVNIDPMAFDDPATGQRLLYWGSGFGPIKVQPLAPDRVSFLPGSRPTSLVAPVPTADARNYRRLVEGAGVIRRGRWYYLFFSGDNCCGPDAHYALMVARSRRATGPFTVRDDKAAPGGVILRARGRWLAPGHNAVIRDRAGDDWLFYHAIDTRRPGVPVNNRRVLLMDRLVWRDGWPSVAGGGPSDGPRAVPMP